ncbi:MAG: hypothetical protein QOF70_5702 [Acetobacteraceae bacterium]|nr:hypothetical protein [Acetobacteraceae bacterium]
MQIFLLLVRAGLGDLSACQTRGDDAEGDPARGSVQHVRELSSQEDHALRWAFGRFAVPEARADGATVVARYQRSGAGCWFLCDCLGRVDQPPALIPVSEAHVRRHHEPPWPDHDPDCDFFRDRAEQRLITRSYRRPAVGKRLALVASLKDHEEARVPRLTARSYGRSRGALATTLMHLIETALVNVIPADGQKPALSDQYRVLRRAARNLQIDDGLALSGFLCTYLPALPDFIAKIQDTSPSCFRKTHRPHGLLIAVVADASVGHIRPLRGEPIPVRGEIAIFGEREGHSRQTAAERRARSPYLAACVVGRAAADTPVEVLKAYLHPCVTAGHLMLVDSDLERRTLAVLVQLQTWLRERKALRVTIKKPVFDLPEIAGGLLLEDGQSSGPCIPDFVVQATDVMEGGSEKLIVETMGYADEVYRDRKDRTHTLMSEALGGAPVVQHDFHFPLDQIQVARDRRFWLECRWILTGLGQGATAGAVRRR